MSRLDRDTVSHISKMDFEGIPKVSKVFSCCMDVEFELKSAFLLVCDVGWPTSNLDSKLAEP